MAVSAVHAHALVKWLDEGQVAVKGTDIWSPGPGALARFRLHMIGFVLQDSPLLPLILQKVAWPRALDEGRGILIVTHDARIVEFAATPGEAG